MIRTLIRVITQGLRSAAAEVLAAAKAHHHYRKAPLTGADKAYCWFQGLCEGIAKAMRQHRAALPHRALFDPTAYPEVHFSARNNGAVLLVEVVREDAAGEPVSVLSTLNYVEAQAVRTGIETLRGTGIFSLTDSQANDLLMCTSLMLQPKAYADRSDPRVTYPQAAN